MRDQRLFNVIASLQEGPRLTRKQATIAGTGYDVSAGMNSPHEFQGLSALTKCSHVLLSSPRQEPLSLPQFAAEGSSESLEFEPLELCSGTPELLEIGYGSMQ